MTSNSDMLELKLPPILNSFPLAVPREAQKTALTFIQNAVERGYRDIVIAAPTGVGKSGIGEAACLWASELDILDHTSGGYYLVTQKMLQDQLQHDFNRFSTRFQGLASSLKSAAEYPCPDHGNCMLGGMRKKANTPENDLEKDREKDREKDGIICAKRKDGSCTYKQARSKFVSSSIAVTNYPYLFTEHTNIGVLPPRVLLVADECHTLEKQVIGFIEVSIDAETLDRWAPACRPVPKLDTVQQFSEWLDNVYLKNCKQRLEMLEVSIYRDREDEEDAKRAKTAADEYNKLNNHIRRVDYARADIDINPDRWVFWQEPANGDYTCTAKPLSAAPFIPDLINSMGAIRLYMSAYPGPKGIFCRNLGLDPENVAWLELDSTFPVENRLIHLTTVGSMGRKSYDETLPKLLRMCEAILDAHPNDKGIIHCHSYNLGKAINDHMRKSSAGGRILFASKSSERASVFKEHRFTTKPTVMLSPSIAEGYSFDDDLARFQIVAKVPYPYLGDKQIAAKIEQDREWYTLETVMTILQACGRIVRSETDHGDTYILDADFIRLYRDNPKFFPKWFKDAFKFYSK